MTLSRAKKNFSKIFDFLMWKFKIIFKIFYYSSL